MNCKAIFMLMKRIVPWLILGSVRFFNWRKIILPYLAAVYCASAFSSLSQTVSTNQEPGLPPALAGKPVRMLSSGALMLLNQSNNLVWRGPIVRPPKISSDSNVVAGLDARVGPNVRLGNDPAQLPTNMLAQAEPHIARHPNDPDTLAATFQEGRFTDGGAVDCGYAISHDGGLTWSRALIPGLTTAVGGPYVRASDPVAGIDQNGTIYLSTLGIVNASQTLSAIAVSRSTNGGASFEPPVEAIRSPDSSVFLDKDWLAVNSFSNTPTAGRLVLTYSRFDSNGSPQARVYSDDGGKMWSTWAYITPIPFDSQGSQPVFLPDGKLAVIYFDFAYANPQPYTFIRVAVSTNGGDTFTFSNQVAQLLPYDAPAIRSAQALPAAIGNRTNNSLYVVYQGLYPADQNSPGGPRILFTKSTDAGVTWSPSLPISDNPTNVQVFNPAVAASPDGQTITVSFYDGRVNPSNQYLVDLFLAQSFDGGNTWQPNIRLTPTSTDARLAPLTAAGYMLGDYLGIAPTTSPDVPAVPVFIDTRTGNPDPFIARVGISPNLSFGAWRSARFSLSEVNSPIVGDPGADPDHDLVVNALEYAFGLNPRVIDKPIFNLLGFSNGPAGPFMASYQRLRSTSDLAFTWLSSSNLSTWYADPSITSQVVTNINPRFEDVTVNFGPKTNSIRSQFYRLGVTLTP
jgi:hypothetical protein